MSNIYKKKSRNSSSHSNKMDVFVINGNETEIAYTGAAGR